MTDGCRFRHAHMYMYAGVLSPVLRRQTDIEKDTDLGIGIGIGI